MAALRSTSDKKHSALENLFDMQSLFEFSTVVNASLDLKFIFNHFLLTLMGKLLSSRGIVLLERKPGIFCIECVKGLPSDLINSEIKIVKIPKRLINIERENIRKNPWLKIFKLYEVDFLLPLITRDRIVGIAGFSPDKQRKKLIRQTMAYLKSIANIAAAAIDKGLYINELAITNRQLDKKIQELETLFELGKEFNGVLDAERLVKVLLFSVMGQIGVNRYVLCLSTSGGQGGEMDVISSRLDKEFDRKLCTYFPSVKSPILIGNLKRKADQEMQNQLMEIGIQVLVPLQLQNQTKGILALGEKLNGESYSKKDLEFLSSLGNLAVISLENARLFREAIEKQRLEDELLIAKEIQKGLLPVKLPTIPNFDIAATNISSKQVGGDYYDIITLSYQHYVIAIGDVSGKGTPASLLMANLQATIRALVPLGLSLGELTNRVNDLICENTGFGRFITFFWGILHVESRTFKYVNAGHNQPILLRADNSIERLDKGGMILGIMKAAIPYQEGEITFNTDDVLVFYTDGVSEAMNSKGEEMGEDRLEGVIRMNSKESADTILFKIVEDVKEYSRNTVQSDDITLVVLKALQ